jgi:hypothetical protein
VAPRAWPTLSEARGGAQIAAAAEPTEEEKERRTKLTARLERCRAAPLAAACPEAAHVARGVSGARARAQGRASAGGGGGDAGGVCGVGAAGGG